MSKTVSIRCGQCGKKIVESLNGALVFRCPRCKHRYEVRMEPSFRKPIMALST